MENVLYFLNIRIHIYIHIWIQKILTKEYIQYSCQKYDSSPIFVKTLEIRLYPETCIFGSQICTLGTQTCTLCSTVDSNIFVLTFLPRLLATLVNSVLYIHEHKR